MQIINRVVSSRPRLSGYFLVDGDYRSNRFHSISNLLSTLPSMNFNPGFLTPTPRTSFHLIAEAPDFESFLTLHPELFI